MGRGFAVLVGGVILLAVAMLPIAVAAAPSPAPTPASGHPASATEDHELQSRFSKQGSPRAQSPPRAPVTPGGTWTWQNLNADSPFDGMSAVMYRPDKIMKAGSWAGSRTTSKISSSTWNAASDSVRTKVRRTMNGSRATSRFAAPNCEARSSVVLRPWAA